MATNSIKINISKENIEHNMKYLKETFKKKILAVVKSNAYGHGINLMTKILLENGCRDFAVARLSEAEEIVKNVDIKDSKIVIFESIGLDYLCKIKENKNFHMTVNVLEELYEAIDYGIPAERIQIKIDFGFGRNGITLDKIEELQKYTREKRLIFSGIYAHLFAVTCEEGLEIIKKFKNIIDEIGEDRFIMKHLQNSVGVENYGSIDFITHLRVGMLIYGLQEEGYYDPTIKQIFFLRGRVAGIRNIENSKYLAYEEKKDLKVGSCKYLAKIKIGYGDGFLKSNEGTRCLINNREFPISLVTMDNTFVEVDCGVKEGDEVRLYYNLAASERDLRMANVEILSILSPRIEREIF